MAVQGRPVCFNDSRDAILEKIEGILSEYENTSLVYTDKSKRFLVSTAPNIKLKLEDVLPKFRAVNTAEWKIDVGQDENAAVFFTFKRAVSSKIPELGAPRGVWSYI
jgi:hypothetical protein